MWWHITGVEQTAKKIKLDNNEKLEREKRTYDQVKRKRKDKLAEKPQLVSSQQWNRPNDMFSLHTIYFFRQDDGDAGDDDVSSDDNTDILSSL